MERQAAMLGGHCGRREAPLPPPPLPLPGPSAAALLALLHGLALLWVTTQTMAREHLYLPFSEALLCAAWLVLLVGAGG